MPVSSHLQPSGWRAKAEAFWRFSLVPPHFFAIKWFVPDGVEVADDGVLITVENKSDLIAFSVL
jgi:hypothetical protein